MRNTISIPINQIIPSLSAIMKAQGVEERTRASEKIIELAREAVSVYKRLINPVGILSEISVADFSAVYYGEGKSELQTPLEGIFGLSDRLCLFAVTIGERVNSEISQLFNHNEFPLGSMLDSTASEGADLAARFAESYYHSYLKDIGRISSSTGLLLFSPGYCGWHISSQKKLFEFLRPAEIGIKLSDSFLMWPLKSVSGVIIVGPKEIFRFDDDFPFCNQCHTHSCRDGIRTTLTREPT